MEDNVMTKKIYVMLLTVAVVATALFMSSCNSNDPATPGEARTYHVSIKASKGTDTPANGPKRVLTPDADSLKATWAAGDEVKVYKTDDPEQPYSFTLLGTLTAQSAGANTTLSGDLTGTINANDYLQFVYNGYPTDYRNQDGTLEYISAHCDLAIANATIESIDGEGYITLVGGTANFVSQQAIVKFTIKDKENNALPVTSITFMDLAGWMPTCVNPLDPSSGSYGSFTVTPASATNEIYVALYNREGFGGVYESRSFKITAVSGGNPYEYNKTVTFDAGKYYTVTMKMAPPIPGRLSGMFTVREADMMNPAKKVYFSQGNLQKSGSAYQFATNQWDYLEAASGATYDLFPWNDGGTSEVGNNAITNGGNTANAGWRTLTKAEWKCLFDRGSGALWKTARINLGGEPAYFVYGLILAPDVLEGTFVAFQRGKFETSMSISEWENDYASQGCVFLPVKYTTDDNIDADHTFTNAYYWTVTESSDDAYVAEYYRTWDSGYDDWDGYFRSTNTQAKTNTLPIRLVIDAN